MVKNTVWTFLSIMLATAVTAVAHASAPTKARTPITAQAEAEQQQEASPPTTIADLPDGNYRYWTGTPSGAIATREEIANQGGRLFRFRKQGNDITGIFGYVGGMSICVEGQIRNNTVTGIARQIDEQGTSQVTVLSRNNSFANFGRSNDLQVRQGDRLGPQDVFYRSALLGLTGYNRINAGTAVPPETCF